MKYGKIIDFEIEKRDGSLGLKNRNLPEISIKDNVCFIQGDFLFIGLGKTQSDPQR